MALLLLLLASSLMKSNVLSLYMSVTQSGSSRGGRTGAGRLPSCLRWTGGWGGERPGVGSGPTGAVLQEGGGKCLPS